MRIPEPAFGKPAANPLAVTTPSPTTKPPPAALAASTSVARDAPRSISAPKPAAAPHQASGAKLYGREDAAWDHAAGEAPGFGYDDELILEIRAGTAGGADTVIAYGTRSGVFLPLGALMRFLDLAITVSDDGHYASGWFLDETRTLTIDLRQSRLVLNGQEMPLARGDAAAFDGELYLRSERFADILPINVATDLRAQAVTIETREPFPFELRLARERERELLAARQGMQGAQRWPREETPWKALDFPMADVQLRAASDSRLGARAEGDLRVTSDFAFVTAQAYASGSSKDGLTAARLELGRRDPDAGLFGPLGATEFQVGDVSMGSLALGLRGTGGRGGFITNASLEQASIFDQIDLRGDLQDGFEVELYRNNILIGSTRNAINGRYEFLQVPVDYGLNVFRLVFYGPQGQRREEVRRLSVGDGRLGKGEFTYSLGALQKDVNLFQVYGPDFNRLPDFGAWRAAGTVSYGISSALTATLAGAWFETANDRRWMAAGGLRTGIAGVGARLDFGYQRGGGKTAQIGLAGRALGAGITLTHAEYRGDFVDEVRAFSNERLRRATDLDLSTAMRMGGGETPALLPIAARLRHLEFADGHKQTNAALRGSLRTGGFLVSNTLDFSRSSTPQAGSKSQLVGTFDLARLSGSRTQLRGAVGYAVLPKARLTTVSGTIDHALDDRTMVSATLTHAFDEPETNVGLSAIRRFDRFTIGIDGNYSFQSKRYDVALRLGFSLGRNPLNGRVFIAQPGLASSGAVALRAYRDVNGDGRFGDGDSILPEVDFFSATQQARTDARGLALLGGLGSGNRASIQVDPDSLPDISLAPVTRGIEVVPRAGRIHAADFAIAALADIEGIARFASEGRQREVSGLRLLLLDARGNTVARARSEADGFFLFERVIPGDYAIAVDPEQALRLGVTVTGGRDVKVAPDGPVIVHDITVAPGGA